MLSERLLSRVNSNPQFCRTNVYQSFLWVPAILDCRQGVSKVTSRLQSQQYTKASTQHQRDLSPKIVCLSSHWRVCGTSRKVLNCDERTNALACFFVTSHSPHTPLHSFHHSYKKRGLTRVGDGRLAGVTPIVFRHEDIPRMAQGLIMVWTASELRAAWIFNTLNLHQIGDLPLHVSSSLKNFSALRFIRMDLFRLRIMIAAFVTLKVLKGTSSTWLSAASILSLKFSVVKFVILLWYNASCSCWRR